MRTYELRMLVIVFTVMLFVAAFFIVSAPARTASEDTAAVYKSKCFACHGAKAEKKFDATKADDDLIQTILKGKKVEKPPHMPGYEEKGMTVDQAKELVAFMRSLKQ
jgi:mono/diheme cytochrome c family protein